MNNAFLFARREFLERVRTKAFLFTTIFFPLMMFGFGVLPTMLATKSGGLKHVEIVASTQAFAEQIKNNLLSATKNDNMKFAVATSTAASDADRTALLQRVTDDKYTKDRLDGVIWATDDVIASGKPQFFGASVGDFKVLGFIESAVNRAVRVRRLAEHGIDSALAEQLTKSVDLEARQVSKGVAKEPTGMATFFTPFMLMFMMYMSMIIYGIAVMRSVLEEKNSKIFEVLLSTSTAQELMAGKVLGVGAVGLFQVAIWTVAALAVSGGALSGAKDFIKFTPSQFIYFGLFFVLGYLIYSSLFAALGAMVNSEQEAQQMQTWVLLPLILPMAFITQIIAQPNSPLAFWASMFPLTSPLLMYVRIVITQPPLWQVALSIGIAIATIYLLLWMCSRIYRIGILMYGKRPTLPEIVKWIKYA